METPAPSDTDKETVLSAIAIHPPSDTQFWHAHTPQFRLAAMELLRQQHYGYNPETDRMVKIFETINLSDQYFKP